MLTLDQIMNESRWVAKMQGWRQAGTYEEIRWCAEDEDCRDVDLAAEQPEHLKEFFDLYFAHDGFITIPDFYEEYYLPAQAAKEEVELVDRVTKALDEAKVSHGEVWSDEPNTVKVEILWGDWKHDHARADWVVSNLGGKEWFTMLTEEDGSDCYSATHKYQF